MSEVTVSFILPVHNVAPYLEQCLESVISQSLEDFEIILVNNGSTDKSLEICNRYAIAHSNIRVIDLNESGVSIARNAGINAAIGKYLCFMDADDFYVCDFAKDFYDECIKHDLDIIRGMYCRYNDDTGNYSDVPFNIPYYDEVMSGTDFLVRSIDAYANEVMPVLGFFKRHLLTDNNIEFPVGIAFEEDQIVYLRALLTAKHVMQKDTILYAYRQRSGSATKTPTVKQASDVSFIATEELKLAAEVTDNKVKKYAKMYAGSSFFQLTCIFCGVPKDMRKEVLSVCNRKTRLICAFNAAARHHQFKNFLFAFCPWFMAAVHDLRNGK